MKSLLRKFKTFCNNNLPILLATFSLPIIFLIFFPILFFNNISWVDPYPYIGFGLNYNEPGFFSGNYKLSRLPFTLTQFLFRTILNPNIAGYVLHFTIYSACAFFMFKLTEKISNKLGAFLIAIATPLFFASCSGGADYHNMFSGLMFIVFLFFITTKTIAKKDDKNFFIITGALYALVMHSNLLMTLDALIYGLFLYLAIKISNNENAFTNVRQKTLYALAGFVAATLILCVINYSFGRHFLFMKPLWSFAKAGGRNQDYWEPLNNFIWQAQYLSGFVALFIFSFFITCKIAITKKIKQNSLIFFPNLAFIIICCITLSIQLAGLHNLHLQYFAFPLLTSFLVTLTINISIIKLDPNLDSPIFAVLTAIFIAILLNSEFLYANIPPNLAKSMFITCCVAWTLFLSLILIFKNNCKIFQTSILATTYFTIVCACCAIFYSKEHLPCNLSKSTADFYVEFNNHLKHYRHDMARHAPENVFAWVNVKQKIHFKKECDFYPNKLSDLSTSIISTGSGYTVELDDVFGENAQDIGMNDIDKLWQENISFQKNNEVQKAKKRFLEPKKYPRILVLITYDENDVKRMIAKMKSYDLNFTLTEKRLAILDSFSVQYFVLTEVAASNLDLAAKPQISNLRAN